MTKRPSLTDNPWLPDDGDPKDAPAKRKRHKKRLVMLRNGKVAREK